MSSSSMLNFLIGRHSYEVPCRVDLEHTIDSLHAHVDLEDETPIGPGDQVLINGDPIDIAYGEKRVIDRVATITRGGWYDRVWARVAGGMEVTELFDVSFTPGRPA